MEAVRAFEMLVHFDVIIRPYIQEDSKLHTSRRENLKFHIHINFWNILRPISAYAFLSFYT
jgi:hypothetical protein